jgi:glutathione synthase/RimK-type ligase-like ATP-grasp enzyme
MKQIALVSYAGCPELTDDDRLLLPALRQLGVEAKCVVWDAPADWTEFDQVILRSCWDYHLRAKEFLDWVSRLEQLAVPVQNSPCLVRWNADKRYLRQLEEAGASIPPTVWIEDREEVSVHEILAARGWESAVVKPTVSASAHNLRRVFKSEPVVRLKGPAMVQEFVPEILGGEWSLVFFGGQYSHAVIKRPAPGDFRVQGEFGGDVLLAEAAVETIEDVSKLFAGLPDQPLYARVDGVECKSGFVLMELELIEPVLFLGIAAASERFAKRIANITTTNARESKTG